MIFLLFTGKFCLARADAVYDMENIKIVLEKRTPPIKVKSIEPTPLAGIYEVYLGADTILYMDKTTSYVLVGGSLLDDITKKNLTTERLKELHRIKFSELPLQNAIEIKKGSGEYKFAVFTDPDCPYCKTLEQSIAKSDLNNYTAYIFLYPLKEIHPDAVLKAESIWCAKDKAQAWERWMIKGNEPAKAACDNPLTKNEKLAEDLDVLGTPTIYLNDGRLSRGLQDLADAINLKNNK